MASVDHLSRGRISPTEHQVQRDHRVRGTAERHGASAPGRLLDQAEPGHCAGPDPLVNAELDLGAQPPEGETAPVRVHADPAEAGRRLREVPWPGEDTQYVPSLAAHL